MDDAIDSGTFERGGYTFEVRIYRDVDTGEPWKNSDGHGVVSDWTSREKAPGEWVLHDDHRSRRYYDAAETLRIAHRDGWGASGERREGETAKAYRARAVREDFEYLRAWCRDEWCYVGVVVRWQDDHQVEASLWGVETWMNYHETVKEELADELLRQIEVEQPDVVLSEN